MQRVYLGLGSNLGDRLETLRRAITAIAGLPSTRLIATSHCYETEPWGDRDQPSFLNLAAEIETALAPLELLNAVKAIEVELGRTATRKWGPRVLDIDLLLWGSETVSLPGLSLPHPRFRERAFVLVPLTEIAPGAVDPVTGRSIAELANTPEAEGQVNRCGPLWPAP